MALKSKARRRRISLRRRVRKAAVKLHARGPRKKKIWAKRH